MNPYVLKAIANQKIAEDRKLAVRYRLAVEAERARREAGQSSESRWPACSGRSRAP